MLSKRLMPLCLLAFAAFSTVDVQTQHMVPFKGSWTGQTISADLSTFPVVGVVSAGGGRITHLGRNTMVSPHTSNVFTGETIGEQIFTAANGDTLTAHCEGFPVSAPDGSTVAGSLNCVFTSGTGRFAGATGGYEFAFASTLIPEALPDVRYATVAAINGMISSVGSSQ